MFCFHPYLGKISILTNIFQKGLVQPAPTSSNGDQNQIFPSKKKVKSAHQQQVVVLSAGERFHTRPSKARSDRNGIVVNSWMDFEFHVSWTP